LAGLGVECLRLRGLARGAIRGRERLLAVLVAGIGLEILLQERDRLGGPVAVDEQGRLRVQRAATELHVVRVGGRAGSDLGEVGQGAVVLVAVGVDDANVVRRDRRGGPDGCRQLEALERRGGVARLQRRHAGVDDRGVRDVAQLVDFRLAVGRQFFGAGEGGVGTYHVALEKVDPAEPVPGGGRLVLRVDGDGLGDDAVGRRE
jgi:hypothetical protein